MGTGRPGLLTARRKETLQTYRSELHIHTVLSPCAGVEMIPPLIVRTALDRGLDLIAITDHNAGENAPAVIQAAEETHLTVLPGMELATREEVHCLCLFDRVDQLVRFQKKVDATLPDIPNRPDFFGEQFIVDKTGDFIQRKKRLLHTSADISFENAHHLVTSLGGLFIPAHVNRQAFGLIEHLGFVPPDLPIAALEISRHINPKEALKTFPQLKGYPLIQNGDVHFLADFLGATIFTLEKPTIPEIKMALAGQSGRHFEINS